MQLPEQPIPGHAAAAAGASLHLVSVPAAKGAWQASLGLEDTNIYIYIYVCDFLGDWQIDLARCQYSQPCFDHIYAASARAMQLLWPCLFVQILKSMVLLAASLLDKTRILKAHLDRAMKRQVMKRFLLYSAAPLDYQAGVCQSSLQQTSKDRTGISGGGFQPSLAAFLPSPCRSIAMLLPTYI